MPRSHSCLRALSFLSLAYFLSNLTYLSYSVLLRQGLNWLSASWRHFFLCIYLVWYCDDSSGKSSNELKNEGQYHYIMFYSISHSLIKCPVYCSNYRMSPFVPNIHLLKATVKLLKQGTMMIQGMGFVGWPIRYFGFLPPSKDRHVRLIGWGYPWISRYRKLMNGCS